MQRVLVTTDLPSWDLQLRLISSPRPKQNNILLCSAPQSTQHISNNHHHAMLAHVASHLSSMGRDTPPACHVSQHTSYVAGPPA